MIVADDETYVKILKPFLNEDTQLLIDSNPSTPRVASPFDKGNINSGEGSPNIDSKRTSAVTYDGTGIHESAMVMKAPNINDSTDLKKKKTQ